ncbi:MAG: NAD-dependent epimerase/dehydratase family protein [Calditrichaeota bacterium]|nr:NAD-dependent epimerase/dehydratase family protein [Calditrichota bacterium]
MQVLVTGANGFVGSFLVEELLRRGHSVRCLVRKTSNLQWIQHLPVDLVYGEVTRPETLGPAVEGVQQVYHLAGVTKARRREDYFRVNAGGTENLLRACEEHAGDLTRFLLVSSQAAAGPSAGPKPRVESDPPHPLTSYGQSKLEAERIVARFRDQLPVSVVRPPAVYGPRDRDVLILFRYVAHGVNPQLGRGERLVSVVHVRDLVQGMLAVANSEAAVGQTYFVAHPEPVEWSAFGETMARAMGRKVRKLVLPAWILWPAALVSEIAARLARRPATLNLEKVREIRERYWVCSVEKLRREVGFTASVDLETGVRETVQWYWEHGWLPKPKSRRKKAERSR